MSGIPEYGDPDHPCIFHDCRDGEFIQNSMMGGSPVSHNEALGGYGAAPSKTSSTHTTHHTTGVVGGEAFGGR